MATKPGFPLAASLLALSLAACGDAATAPLRPSTHASVADQSAVTLTAQLQPPAPSPTATAAQFRWLEPIGTGGNTLGAITNSASYLPYLQVDLCAIAAPDGECGTVVAGSLATAANGGVALTADGKAYAATFRARDLPLEPARDYRLRVRLADPAGATVQVGYQDVDVSGGARGSARPGFYVTNTKQNVPVRFIVGPGIPRAIAITPAIDTILVGTTRGYSATVTDWASTPIADAPVSWLVADPAIAGVAASGALSALDLGRTTLYASSGGITASQPVVVKSPVVRVTLVQSPANPVAVGSAVTFTATAFDAGGNVVTARPYAWTGASASGAVATLTPASSGSFPVSVSVDGASATLSVDAVPAATGVPVAKLGLGAAVVTMSTGDNPAQPISASLWDARGLPVDGRVVTWSSSRPDVVSVDPDGHVHAIAPGYAYVSATSEGVTSRLVAIVTPVGGGIGNSVGSIVVLPPEATIAAGDTVRLVAVVLDTEGNPIAGKEIGWTAGNSAVAITKSVADQTVLVLGVASGVSPAYANVTAIVPVNDARGSVSGVARIAVTSTVPPSPTAGGQIIVTPNPLDLMVGEQATVTAQVLDANGNAVNGVPLVWTVGNTEVASISGSGYSVTVTALGGGLTNVRATGNELTGATLVNVTAPEPPPPPPSSLAVTPATATISQATTSCVQLTASYTSGTTTTDVTTLAAWSAGSGVVSVSKGLVCGTNSITNGRQALAGVTATYSGLSASAVITVNP